MKTRWTWLSAAAVAALSLILVNVNSTKAGWAKGPCGPSGPPGTRNGPNVNGYVRTAQVEWVEGSVTVETSTDATAGAPNIKLNGLDKEGDPRPVLVLSVNSDEKVSAGGSTKRLMANVFNAVSPEADMLARETQLFRCIKIDTTTTPTAALAFVKISAAPAIMILTPAGEPVGAVNANGLTPRALASSLDRLLANNFKDYFAKVTEQREQVKKLLDEGMAALRKGDRGVAKSKLNEILAARVGNFPAVERAQEQLVLLAKLEAKEQAAKEQANKS